MELINYCSVDVKLINKTQEAYVKVAKTGTYLYISKRACHKFEFKEDQYFHFLVDLKRIYFVVNNNSDGCRLRHTGGSHSNSEQGLKFTAKPVLDIILYRIPQFVKGAKYKINKTKTEYNGQAVYEILLDQKLIHKTNKKKT